MSILSQLGITQAQALSSSTIGRYDFFVDSSDGKLKAFDENNNLELVGGGSTAADIPYTLTIPSNWDGTPANIQAALDELASRTKGIEGKTDLITVTAAVDLDDVKAKADSALQSGDNVSELVNDSGYITDIVGENHSDLTLDDGTNPHGTTKSDVGLANADNTSDANKPISSATQTALDGKKNTFTENTAFNKDFGTTSGTVLEGDTRTITPSEISTIANQSGTNTGDETDASIKTKYENNADTNAFTDSEKTKLAGLESSKFVGEFVSLSALQTAFSTAPIGSYAYVDTGVGQPVEKYIWDNNDSQWELQQGQSTAETPATIKSKYESNPDTNAFTDAEQTNLGNQSGINTGDENTNTIQTKRPLKTIENQSLEGVGNIDLSKSDVGLGNVDNTSDLNKPISTSTQNALNSKENSFTKNSAFNKNFGTNSGEVLEGDTRTITPIEITTISNQSGTNSGDETTATIQSKRPLKTVDGQTLEGSGNIPFPASGGDMLKSVYDTNNDGIVDKSQSIVYKAQLSQSVVKGNLVYAIDRNPTTGNPIVGLADNTVSFADKTVGIALSNGSGGQVVEVMKNGVMENLNTSLFSVGETLYLSTNGTYNSLSNITTGNINPVAFVVKSSLTTGAIVVDTNATETINTDNTLNESNVSGRTITDALEEVNKPSFYDRDIPGIYLANQTTVALANQQTNVYEQYGEGLTFTPVVTDNYSLGVSWVWSSNVQNQSMDFRISVIEDGGTPTELLNAKYENKEVGGTGVVVNVIENNAINGNTNTGTDTRIPQTVHADFNLTSGVEYKWILEFLAEGVNPTALTIYVAQISIEQKTIRTV